jgi:hypothetical protein
MRTKTDSCSAPEADSAVGLQGIQECSSSRSLIGVRSTLLPSPFLSCMCPSALQLTPSINRPQSERNLFYNWPGEQGLRLRRTELEIHVVSGRQRAVPCPKHLPRRTLRPLVHNALLGGRVICAKWWTGRGLFCYTLIALELKACVAFGVHGGHTVLALQDGAPSQVGSPSTQAVLLNLPLVHLGVASEMHCPFRRKYPFSHGSSALLHLPAA